MPIPNFSAEELQAFIDAINYEFLDLVEPLDSCKCGGCNRDFKNFDTRMSPVDRKRYCQSCMQSKHYRCRGCRTIFVRPNGNTTTQYCEPCSASFEPCFRCQTRFHPNDRQTFQDAEGITRNCCSSSCVNHYMGLCNECGGRHLLPFEPRSCPTKYPPLPSDYSEHFLPNRVFSVELETNISVDPPIGWKAVSDGSISGLEYLSGPVLGPKGADTITAACTYLNAPKKREPIDSRCGYHLHMNAKDLSEEQVCNFLRTAYLYQKPILKLVKEDRRNNRYALLLPDKFSKCDASNLEEVIYGDSDDYDEDERNDYSRMKREKYHGSRYTWVNPHSYYFRGTLEVRLHQGTTNPDYVLNWAELFLKFLNLTASSGYNEGIYKKVDLFDFLKEAGVRQSTLDFYRERVEAYANA